MSVFTFEQQQAEHAFLDKLEGEERERTCQLAFPHRTFWHSTSVAWQDDDGGNYEDAPDEVRQPTNQGKANLISSLCANGMHAPTLDIDFAAQLVESRTPGHYHLYLDKQMPWWKYRVLLKVLAWVGIIEPGYYRASVASNRKMTFLRWDYWFSIRDDADVDKALNARLRLIEKKLRRR